MIQNDLHPLDIDIERRRALAKVFSLLIKLVEDSETTNQETDHEEKEASAPLNN